MTSYLQSNLTKIEEYYPGLAGHLRQCDPTPPEADEERELQEYAVSEFDERWSMEAELHILYRFIDSPLTWKVFNQINLQTLWDNKNRRLLLLDDRFELFRWSIEEHNWRTLLDSGRGMLSIASSLEKVLEQVLLRYPEIAHAESRLYAGLPGLHERYDEALQSILDKHRTQLRQNLRNCVQQCSKRTPPPFLRNIRFFVAGHNYIQEACTDAFHQLGYEAGRLSWRDPLYRFIHPVAWIHEHRKQPIDCAFFLNATPKSFLDAGLFQQFPISSISWFVDNPRRYERPDENIFEDCDTIGVFDRSYVPYLNARSNANVLEVRTAFGIDRKRIANGDDYSSIDVAFVGELGTRGFLLLERGIREMKPEILPHSKSLLDANDIYRPIELDPIAERELERIGVPYRGMLVSYLENLATYLRRRHYLEVLADRNLKIFGPREWNDDLLAGPLVDCYQGKSIDYATELPALYANAKININIFHVQCAKAPNPRVYDVLACGGFLLTTYNPGLEDEFVIGEDLDVFHTKEELAEKVDFYLAHPEIRRAMAESGYRRALARCGYHDRMQKFLSSLSRPPAGESYVYIRQ